MALSAICVFRLPKTSLIAATSEDFVDVDKETYCIDIYDVERKLSRQNANDVNTECFVNEDQSKPKIKAIMPVHFGGQPCDMESILELAKKYNLKVVEDSAHGLPSTYRWKRKSHPPSRIGTIGDITCFSFYANKTITTGEGGMLVTNSDDIAERVKVMRLHGIDRDIWDRYKSDKPSWYYEVIEPGYKYNMTDIAAAIGTKQLDKCDEFHQKRVGIAKYYTENLTKIEGLRLPGLKCLFNDHSWHLFVILIEPPENNGRISRDEFINKLSKMINKTMYRMLQSNTTQIKSIKVTINGCKRKATKPTAKAIKRPFHNTRK